jgi:hypothetical protein
MPPSSRQKKLNYFYEKNDILRVCLFVGFVVLLVLSKDYLRGRDAV